MPLLPPHTSTRPQGWGFQLTSAYVYLFLRGGEGARTCMQAKEYIFEYYFTGVQHKINEKKRLNDISTCNLIVLLDYLCILDDRMVPILFCFVLLLCSNPCTVM